MSGNAPRGAPPPIRGSPRPDDLNLYSQANEAKSTETPSVAQAEQEPPLKAAHESSNVATEPFQEEPVAEKEESVEKKNEQIFSPVAQQEQKQESKPEQKVEQKSKPEPEPKSQQNLHEKHETPPLYPIGPDGKRNYSLSPAQRLYPDKKFDSNLTIYYKNVSCKVSVSSNPNAVSTFITPCVSLGKAIATKCKSCEKSDFYRLKDASGIIRPGTMTLVLSPPGHGKSSFLRALSNRIPSTGHVAYNGRNFDQAAAEGCDLKKMTQYVDQVDTHLPILTVDETLDFAHKLTSVHYDRQRVEDAITLLGLEECRDTIIGNELVRGVSGGQRKRVTTGELLTSDASILFFDEFSNGLDASTAEDIATGLKKFCLKHNSSVVATLQQPTPELFALFDRIIILLSGQVVFDGPVIDVIPFFSGMGFTQPDDVDVADFLIDCLTQPRNVILNQKQAELRKQNKSQKKGTASKQAPSNKPKIIKTSYGPINVSPEPCITVEQMVDYFHSTPHWAEIKETLDSTFPGTKDDESDQPGKQQAIQDFSSFSPLMPTDDSKLMFRKGDRLSALQTLAYVLERQSKLWARNKAVLFPRVFMAIFLSLLYGFLYYNVGASEFILRLASLFICVSQVAFGNMIEIPVSVETNRVVSKQLAARFYPSWISVLSQALMSFPMALIEGTIYGLMMYFLTGAYPGGVQFIVFWAILIVQSFQFSAWFRFLTVIGKDVAKSQSMAGPSTGVFMVFAGLFITKSNVPNFMIWLYYLSPFSWTVRALSNNEFLSPRYDTLVSVNGQVSRIGHIYLNQIDMDIGSEWILWCLIYLIGISAFIIFIHSWILITRYYEESIGTRRSNDKEIVETEMDEPNEPIDDDQLKLQVEAAAIAQVELSKSGVQSSTGAASTTTGKSSVGSSALKTLRENLPFAPSWLSFSDVTYTVKVKKEKELVDRVLLNTVSGYAQPGKMLALMGASGAGKTTLLDVLAGLKNTGVVDGKILINGQPATKQLISQVCGYVEQFDTLFSFNTVRETLLFAANLRLPYSVPATIKAQIVDEILEILDLTSISDFLIGNALVIGLSPAQRKRVSIGVELVANPAILFLDEPTTGLDSASANTVLKVVKRISRSGRAIIVTIHQPNSELFFMFDRLLLLGAGGHQIFFGDIGPRAKTFIQYLSRCAGVTPIRPRVNPASWMLIELGVGVASEKGDLEAHRADIQRSADTFEVADEPEWADMEQAKITVQRFKKTYKQSDFYKTARKRLDVLESIEIIDPTDSTKFELHKQQVELANMKRIGKSAQSSTATSDEEGVDTSRTFLPRSAVVAAHSGKAPVYVQLPLLFSRNMMAYWRNPTFLHSRLGITAFLSILFGLVYFDLNAYDIPSATSLIGACFMSIAFAAIVSAATSLPIQFESRETFYREKAGGYYSSVLYGPVQLSIELLWNIPGTFLAVIPAYFLVNLRQDVSVFFGYCLSTYLLLIAYISFAQCLASFAPNQGLAQVLQGSMFSLLNAFAGISITYPALNNGFFQFLYRIFPNSHIFQAIIMPQFDANTSTITYLSGSQEITEPVRDYVARYLGWTYGHSARQLGYAMIPIVVLQLLHFFFTGFISHNKR